jgi:hypothetical protein
MKLTQTEDTMQKSIKLIFLGIFISAILSSFLYAQTVAWTYCCNGTRHMYDEGISIVQGPDTNLYIGGYLDNNVTYADFAVVNLTASGAQRWIYQHDGGADAYAEYAKKILYGSNGNLYAAGTLFRPNTGYDFTVMSLDRSGSMLWTYNYNYPGNGFDWANAMVEGRDENLYAAGLCGQFNSNHSYFNIISLTLTGTERWRYIWPVSVQFYNEAFDIAVGHDGNIYAAGTVWGEEYDHEEDFAVVSLRPDGTQRWQYLHNGPASSSDCAYAIACAPNGMIYAAGKEWTGQGARENAFIAALDSNGIERWTYSYNGTNNNADIFWSITLGDDGNIYAAGQCNGDWNGGNANILVVSLDTNGNQRWAYTYNGTGNYVDYANRIIYGGDGYLYMAGASYSSVNLDADLIVISLRTGGQERWIYRNGGTANLTSEAHDLIYTADDKLYVCGYIHNGVGHQGDFTVICLYPGTGVEETFDAGSTKQSTKLNAAPNPFISYTKVLGHEKESFAIYDNAGKLVGTEKGSRIGIGLCPGVYFLKPLKNNSQIIRIVKVGR